MRPLSSAPLWLFALDAVMGLGQEWLAGRLSPE
jgi:hypothetical protein